MNLINRNVDFQLRMWSKYVVIYCICCLLLSFFWQTNIWQFYFISVKIVALIMVPLIFRQLVLVMLRLITILKQLLVHRPLLYNFFRIQNIKYEFELPMIIWVKNHGVNQFQHLLMEAVNLLHFFWTYSIFFDFSI